MHIPERMCIGCRRMLPKSCLIKFVKKDDNAELDLSLKKEGRGAYVCKDAECIEIAKKKKALSKHFKMPVPDTLYDEVKEFLNG